MVHPGQLNINHKFMLIYVIHIVESIIFLFFTICTVYYVYTVTTALQYIAVTMSMPMFLQPLSEIKQQNLVPELAHDKHRLNIANIPNGPKVTLVTSFVGIKQMLVQTLPQCMVPMIRHLNIHLNLIYSSLIFFFKCIIVTLKKGLVSTMFSLLFYMQN
uniref:Uncharacterized protein n=1 Tax=Pyxicephalus adspersus TaxID=30357 RepID=A0AAV3B2J9_PYXAD|nr:TPA: hypothetical protein GDO54_001305 [Pyxicephalus adspersus]